MHESSSLDEWYRVSSRFHHFYVGNQKTQRNCCNLHQIIDLYCECDVRHLLHNIGGCPLWLIEVLLVPLLLSSQLTYQQEALGLYPSYSRDEHNERRYVLAIRLHDTIRLHWQSTLVLILFLLHLPE